MSKTDWWFISKELQKELHVKYNQGHVTNKNMVFVSNKLISKLF